jgi:hypothetical protein
MAKRKKTDIVPLMLRLRENLRKQLEIAAKAEDRSLNAEIVRRLESTFLHDDTIRDRVAMFRLLEELGAHVADLKAITPPLRDPDDRGAPESEDPAQGMENVFPLKRGTS